MRHTIPIGILACSVSFSLAAGPMAGKTQAVGEPDFLRNETAVPAPKRAPSPGKTEKAPTPQAQPETPEEEEEPAESPAEAEDLSECEECVIVRTAPSPAPTTPVFAAESPAAAAGAVAGAAGSRKRDWPFALARTLWGLFFVGRPRLLPKTRIRGITVR